MLCRSCELLARSTKVEFAQWRTYIRFCDAHDYVYEKYGETAIVEFAVWHHNEEFAPDYTKAICGLVRRTYELAENRSIEISVHLKKVLKQQAKTKGRFPRIDINMIKKDLTPSSSSP